MDPECVDVSWDQGLTSDIDASLSRWGRASPPAIDLVRIAVAAFVADQAVERPRAFERELTIRPHLVAEATWTDDVLFRVTELLASLTGDLWTVDPLSDEAAVEAEPIEVAPARRVSLLSGGLDSFAGAVLSSGVDGATYLGHWGNPMTKRAQNDMASWFRDSGRRLDYQTVRLQPREKIEGSTRSRAALFMALAAAYATTRGAEVVEVPENGFTSLNIPLGPERMGPWSTRSTHPVTIDRFNGLLRAIGLPVAVENPHALKTKGELVTEAARVKLGDFAGGAAKTLSCGKLNGHHYKGGDANGQCGLCIACVTRRAAFIAAGVPDGTPYLCDTLTGNGLSKLRSDRTRDVQALRRTFLEGITDADLMAIGPYPASFDIDAGVELVRRGLAELEAVPLP